MKPPKPLSPEDDDKPKASPLAEAITVELDDATKTAPALAEAVTVELDEPKADPELMSPGDEDSEGPKTSPPVAEADGAHTAVPGISSIEMRGV